MPFPTGVVKPVLVARNLVAQASSSDVTDSKLNDLEAFTNGTLANTIRQLSSLSKQAEGMFGELIREAHSLTARVHTLQIRLDRLSISTKQLHSDEEKVPLRSMHPRKDFKSVVVFDRQVFSRDTMPKQLLETYSKCDKPPSLYKLNPYREDGQDSMKFYTDPNHFFDLMRLRTLRDVVKLTHGRGGKRNNPSEVRDAYYRRAHKIVKQPSNTRERHKQLAIQNGEYIMSREDSHYRDAYRWCAPCNYGIITRQYERCRCAGSPGEITSRRAIGLGAEIGPSQTPPLDAGVPSNGSSYSRATVTSASTAATHAAGHRSRADRKKMPAPPPPPVENCPRPSAAEPCSTSRTPADVPPAPPLPTPPPPALGPRLAMSANRFAARRPPPSPIQYASVPSRITHLEPWMPPAGCYDATRLNGDFTDGGAAVNETTANRSSRIVARKTPETAYRFDLHNDLLKAIKDGVELRKVGRDKQKEEERNDGAFRGLDMILSRRVAIEISDSDSSSSKGYDSDGWAEETYTLANSSGETPRKS